MCNTKFFREFKLFIIYVDSNDRIGLQVVSGIRRQNAQTAYSENDNRLAGNLRSQYSLPTRSR